MRQVASSFEYRCDRLPIVFQNEDALQVASTTIWSCAVRNSLARESCGIVTVHGRGLTESPIFERSGAMNLVVVLIILLLLFGGGGFYLGGPAVGGGLGGIILLVLIVMLLTGRLGSRA
jgi:hypothetical protein